MTLLLVGLLYNYTYWSNTERNRIDGPPRGMSRNSFDVNNIDDVIRRVIDHRVDEAFADRPDDVSGANNADRYLMVRQSGDKCCRGEDRLQVSSNFYIRSYDRMTHNLLLIN